MDLEITDVSSHDLDTVLALNEAEVPHVGAIDIGGLSWFAHNADYFRICRSGDRVAAFLIGLLPGSEYPSPNYRWFCDRYNDFAYIDRVAVHTDFRRRGLASGLYADLQASLPQRARLLTCEVNVQPPNPGSMRFHENLGFEVVGEQVLDRGAKVVAMLVKTI